MLQNNISAIRKRRGLSQGELAQMVGTKLTMLGKLERGERELNIRWIEKISSALNVAPQELFSGEIETQPILEGAIPMRRMPVLGSVPAGNWHEAVENATGTKLVGPDTPPNAYGLVITGDSMDLVANEGDTITIDPDDHDLWPNRYYVVKNGEGEATFKQYRDSPARFAPCSSNDEHKVIPMGEFEIVGRVINISRDV